LSYGQEKKVIEQWLNGRDEVMKEIAIKRIVKGEYKELLPQAINMLEQWLGEKDIKIRKKALKYIGEGKFKEMIPALAKILETEESSDKKIKKDDKEKEKEIEDLKITVVTTLGEFKNNKEIISLLVSVLKKERYPIRIACIKSLGNIGSNDVESLNILIDLLDEYNPGLVLEVLNSLEKIGDKRLQFFLVDVVKGYKDMDVKKRALDIISKIGNKKIIKELKDAIRVNKEDNEYKDIVPYIEKTIDLLSKRE